MILSGQTIRRLNDERELIRPFVERSVANGMSYGLSSAGYDVRVEFDARGEVPGLFITDLVDSAGVTGRPHKRDGYEVARGFALVSTIEELWIPEDVMVIVHDKSTWARRGVAVQNTVFEPGWHGFPTLELSFHGEGCVRITRGDPIAQLVFHKLDEPVERPYGGKYQSQLRGPTNAKREADNS